VKFNTKVRYGIRAMLEISFADPNEGILQKDIAVNQEISVKYLDSIISHLKIAGLITSVSGKKSGYRITRSPDEITMLDIFEAFEPGMMVNECINQNFDCTRRKICSVFDFWSGLNVVISDYFRNYTLADMQLNEKMIKAASS